MFKTGCRFLQSTMIKKEEREDGSKQEKDILHSTNTATKTINKIKKNRNSIQIQVKAENEDDNKALLASPKKKTLRRSEITTEQIENLIGYIANDKMNVLAASKKVGMSQATAYSYYQDYQNDPEHKIPAPKTGYNRCPSTISQQKINDLIHYIVNSRMNISQASKKVDMNRYTAKRYYAKYLEDPERKIPLLDIRTGRSSKRYTKEEITDLIGYIVNDNMSLMSASVKVNMSVSSAKKYYRQYLEDPEKNIPTPDTNNTHVTNNPPTADQVKSFFCYIIIDKLNVSQAARKAKIPESSGYLYYRKYLKSPNSQTNIKDMTYSADKMKRLIELVQNEKMSLNKAAYTVNLNASTARKHYQKYLKDPQYKFPAIKSKQYTQEDVQRLIDYIERDKMSVLSAARRIKMNHTSASKYYKIYQNDPKHRIPVPNIRGQTIKNKKIDTYTQIIADIYKSNPSIKPLSGIQLPELDAFNIKEEPVEEDAKMALKGGK